MHETYRNLVVTRRSRCNYGNSHPRNVTFSRAAPAVLALLVLFQPHCHSSSSSSSSFSSTSFLLWSASSPLVFSLSLNRACLLCFNYLPLPFPLSSLVTACCSGPLHSLSPRPRGNAPPKNVDLSSLRLSSCSVAERALTHPFFVLCCLSLSSSSCSSTSISSSFYAARNKPTSTRTLSLAAIDEASW